MEGKGAFLPEKPNEEKSFFGGIVESSINWLLNASKQDTSSRDPKTLTRLPLVN